MRTWAAVCGGDGGPAGRWLPVGSGGVRFAAFGVVIVIGGLVWAGQATPKADKGPSVFDATGLSGAAAVVNHGRPVADPNKAVVRAAEQERASQASEQETITPVAGPEIGTLRRRIFHEQVAALQGDPNCPVRVGAEELSAWIARLDALAIGGRSRGGTTAGSASSAPGGRVSVGSGAHGATPIGAADAGAVGTRIGRGQGPTVTPDPNATTDPLVAIAEGNPEKIAFPLKAADALFAAGRYETAFLYYKAALGRTKADEADADRPWILIQMANCVRRRDPSQAEALYSQLTAEYPNHPLTVVAQAQKRVLGTIRQQAVLAVLENHGHDPNDF